MPSTPSLDSDSKKKKGCTSKYKFLKINYFDNTTREAIKRGTFVGPQHRPTSGAMGKLRRLDDPNPKRKQVDGCY